MLAAIPSRVRHLLSETDSFQELMTVREQLQLAEFISQGRANSVTGVIIDGQQYYVEKVDWKHWYGGPMPWALMSCHQRCATIVQNPYFIVAALWDRAKPETMEQIHSSVLSKATNLMTTYLG